MLTIEELLSIFVKGNQRSKLGNRVSFLEADPYLEKLAISMVSELLGCKKKYVLDVQEIRGELETSGLFSQGTMYIVRDPSLFVKKPEEYHELKISGDNVLVCIYSSIDKNGKLWATIKDELCFSPKLNKAQFADVLRMKWPSLTTDSCNMVAEHCGFDTELALTETNKLYILSIVENKDVNELVKTWFAEGLNPLSGVSQGEVCESVFRGEIVQSLSGLARFDESELDALAIVNSVHEACKGALVYKPRGLALTEKQILEKMELSARLERAIKSGEIDEDVTRDYVAIKLTIGGTFRNEQFV